MGRAGIKRRKPKRAEGRCGAELGPDDTDARRLFGQFTWAAYTPAGNLERHRFLWRQVQRNGVTGWRAAVTAVLWLGAVALLAGTVISVVVLLVHVLV
ncbi:MAG TPA: hypothetical protein VFZ83_03190 [Acidimicrobiia bacterium]|nr:hypothetical protein [Acidimicrobiia bacterium]